MHLARRTRLAQGQGAADAGKHAFRHDWRFCKVARPKRDRGLGEGGGGNILVRHDLMATLLLGGLGNTVFLEQLRATQSNSECNSSLSRTSLATHGNSAELQLSCS